MCKKTAGTPSSLFLEIQEFGVKLFAQGGAMLVLTRRVNESIVIGNDIVVTVLEVQRDSIRLGIKAPHNVEINREEIFLLLSEKTKDAASIAAETSLTLHKVDKGLVEERAEAGA